MAIKNYGWGQAERMNHGDFQDFRYLRIPSEQCFPKRWWFIFKNSQAKTTDGEIAVSENYEIIFNLSNGKTWMLIFIDSGSDIEYRTVRCISY